jgi:hypothetical protein
MRGDLARSRPEARELSKVAAVTPRETAPEGRQTAPEQQGKRKFAC